MKTLDEWKKEAEASEAEKNALDAQVALIASRNALQKAQNPDPAKSASDEKAAAANAAKAISDAEKAASDSDKAKAEAEAAALKARFGDIPSSGYTGSVELKDKAGNTEAALLAARAIVSSAQKVISRPRVQAAVSGKEVRVYALGDVPNWEALILFRSYSNTIRGIFEQANSDATNRLNQDGESDKQFTATAVPLLALGLGLDAVNKLLGFFRTDYTVGGIELGYEDAVLVHAAAGELCRAGATVKIPSLFDQGALANGGGGVLKELSGWESLRSEAEDRISMNEKDAEDLASQASAPNNSAKASTYTAKAKAHSEAAAILKTAIAAYDNISMKLTTADAKGVVPLATTIREQSLFDFLCPSAGAPRGVVLFAKIQKSGGSYYTKKDIGTVFGGMPLYHMGGVVVSFVLMGSEGKIEDAGVVPVHGGFVRAPDLAGYLDKS